MENNDQQTMQDIKVSCANFSAGDGSIRDEEALRMICEFKKYLEEGHDLPNDNERAKAVWFHKDDILEICEYLKKTHVSGLRVYFGKYPSLGYELVKDRDDINIHYNYNNKFTVVFVPTKRGVGKKHDNILKDIKCKDLPKPSAGKSSAIAYNHGQLCPPKDDCRRSIE